MHLLADETPSTYKQARAFIPLGSYLGMELQGHGVVVIFCEPSVSSLVSGSPSPAAPASAPAAPAPAPAAATAAATAAAAAMLASCLRYLHCQQNSS